MKLHLGKVAPTDEVPRQELPTAQERDAAAFVAVLQEAGELETNAKVMAPATPKAHQPVRISPKPRRYPARLIFERTAHVATGLLKVGAVIAAILLAGALVANLPAQTTSDKLYDPTAKPFVATPATDLAPAEESTTVPGTSVQGKASTKNQVEPGTKAGTRPGSRTKTGTATKSGTKPPSNKVSTPSGTTPSAPATPPADDPPAEDVPAPEPPSDPVYDTTDSTPGASSQTSTKKPDSGYAGTDNRPPSSNDSDGGGVSQDDPVAEY